MTQPTEVTIDLSIPEPEYVNCTIHGAPSTTYEVLVEATRDGRIVSNGSGPCETDSEGVGVWNEFGASDGTGLEYVAVFTVGGSSASIVVPQHPPWTDE